jgi:hypothetical protein
MAGNTNRRLRPVLVVLALAWLAYSAVPGQAQGDDSPPAPDSRFGVIEAYHEPEMADQLGVGWERIIFYWSELEKRGPGDWNWFHAPVDRLDRELEGGREIVGLLAHTPAWATRGIPGAGLPYGLYHPLDDPTNYWARFVRRAVRAYKDQVHRWVIWNEPDIALDDYGAQWQGTTEDYYQLVKTAYIVAHEVDPSVKIHLGGLTYWHNPNYLREFLTVASRDPTAVENGYYFDVVSVHVYFKPETTLDIIGSLQATLDEFGLGDKAIWINETNAPPYDDPAQRWDAPVFEVTQEMQASFLLQEFALALSMGVERIAVYKWIDEPPLGPGFEPYGLLRTDRTPRPAFEAFRLILAHYSGVEDALRFTRPEMHTVILERDAHTTRVLWARTPYDVLAVVPALADAALLIDQTGAQRVVRPKGGLYLLALDGAPCRPDEECLMGGPPLLLVEEAPVDLSDVGRLRSRLVIDITPRLVTVLIGGAIAGLIALGVVYRLYRRRKGRGSTVERVS